MAIPVVQNTQTNTGTVTSSVVVTKPTGLAVGDLMVASIAFFLSGGSRTFTTPAGWTQGPKTDGNDTGLVMYTKVADSSDVAASNFTFSLSGSADCISGSVSRINGYSSVGSSEIDSAGTPNATVATFTTNVAPTVTNNLLIFSFAGSDGTYSGTPTVSTYTISPSETITEIADIGIKNGANIGLAHSVVTVSNTGTDTVTSRGATFSDTINNIWASIFLVIEGIVDATGTNATFAVSPFLPSQNGVAGTTGTNALHTATPTMFDQSGKATTGTVWTNEAEATTTWTNETL